MIVFSLATMMFFLASLAASNDCFALSSSIYWLAETDVLVDRVIA
jgi:hypothetical protein